MFRIKSSILILATLCSIAAVSLSAPAIQDFQDPQKARKIKRAKKPVFTERDSDGIFFKNLFEEGLVGPRPSQSQILASKTPAKKTAETRTTDKSTAFAWSKFIDREVIEDEVKFVQQRLTKQVTTPVRFKSDYGAVRQSFSSLSMLFAIVNEYDADVRWKKDAIAAQAAFARAAANSRVGSQQAYQGAKLRLLDLTDMVRGGNFAGKAPANPNIDWANVVDRGTLMEMLETSFGDTLKPGTASKTEMAKTAESVLHQANMVAAIGQVLTKEGMDEADEEDYAKYAIEMRDAARKLSLAVKSNDYDSASSAANAISQSCSNCHDEWR